MSLSNEQAMCDYGIVHTQSASTSAGTLSHSNSNSSSLIMSNASGATQAVPDEANCGSISNIQLSVPSSHLNVNAQVFIPNSVQLPTPVRNNTVVNQLRYQFHSNAGVISNSMDNKSNGTLQQTFTGLSKVAVGVDEFTEQRKCREYSTRECDILKSLVIARRQYLNHADENWQNFLDKVQNAYVFFFADTPRRLYRDNFTIENYRMLFQRESSAYRDDVCRGVKRIRDGMWVNGEEVKFPESLVEQGYELADRGEKLMDIVYLLDDLGLHRLAHDGGHPATRESTMNRLKTNIKMFDEKYTVFEQNYIEALIAVEKQSRNLVQAIAELIEQCSQNGEYMNQDLLNKMAELNKKSRDVFNCEYKYSIVKSCFIETYKETVHQRLWHLPNDLICAFEEVCKYLKELLPKILRVHPKLEHNPGLVCRMERFHDSYIRVKSWISQDSPMSRFCYFLETCLPDLDLNQALDSSVDSILQIPRLFCLFVWENRSEFENENTSLTKLVHELHPDILIELSKVFIDVDNSHTVVELFRKTIAEGVDSPSPSNVAKELETVSMQLQRKNANAWNAFVSVILHEEDDPRQRPRLPSV